MCPGNACTSGTSWLRASATAVPQTPRPTGMRTQAGLPWNGPEHQLLALQEIEARPVDARQRVKDQRRDVGRVRDRSGSPATSARACASSSA
jgi:hypothetical protein